MTLDIGNDTKIRPKSEILSDVRSRLLVCDRTYVFGNFISGDRYFLLANFY
ncbi:MAG: hypothetical protein KME59_18025 [Trichormus sp. ATA11-4-KO1]|nr:hypothetical protein [Trichormus sp. ATA11-4-KO1]